jgi:hypothetical protein
MAIPLNGKSARYRTLFETPTEGEGFEPSSEEKSPETVFETAAFNHSATPPDDVFLG